MKLRKPCEHGRYDEHSARASEGSGMRPAVVRYLDERCPGGEFLTNDDLVAIVDSMDGVAVYVRGQMGYDPERDQNRCAHGMTGPHSFPDVKPGELTGAWREQCPGPVGVSV